MSGQWKQSPKFLVTISQIRAYLGNIGIITFKKYIDMGMPARYENGRGWLAHTDNIDEWFRLLTSEKRDKKASKKEE